METLDTIKEKISKLLEEQGCSLYRFSYVKRQTPGMKDLEVIIDKDGDISMDEIVDLSHMISDFLDENPFTDLPYNLNICSAGAEKEIDINKIEKYLNRYLFVHTINPIDGLNGFEGTVTEINDTTITVSIRVKTRIKNVQIERSNIDRVRLAIKF